METSFEWPHPPYFAFAPGSEKGGPEACLVYLRNGSKLLGNLIRFSPEESSVVFQPTRKESNETIGLDQIKSIRLVRPLLLRRDKQFLEERAQEVIEPAERQVYTVEFTDNEIMTGDTVHYTIAGNGLFLFLPAEDEKIVRCFVPQQAMKNYQIGKPLGEMLVEEHLASKAEVEAALERQHHLRVQRIGDYLAENQIVSRDMLAKAIRHQETQPILKLGEALIQLKLLTPDQLEAALAKQRQNRKQPLGQILVEMGVIDERALNGALANKLGIPYVSLTKFNFDPNAIKLVNASIARKQTLMPLCMHDNALVVAFENPLNAPAMEELRFLAQMRIVPAMASREDILASISEYYGSYGGKRFEDMAANSDTKGEYEFHSAAGSDVKIDELASKLFVEDSAMDVVEETVAESDNVLVQLVNKIILDAYSGGISDIHVETYPGKQNTRVRFRKDGTLIDYLEIPPNFRNAVISRIKIMSQLDISERRKPQDGKIDFQQFGPAKIELRVASVPTANGLEDIVMRVLAAAKPIPVDGLGLAPDSLAVLKRLMERPYGLVLVCGPTGSGKTTTLHSLLGYINVPGRKIWTAEDPIEITQGGLRQVQVNAKIGWTFAGAMRSFLRADPDVIMVGEMRDPETTKIGIEASLTGHLVLSTLHTNSAPESVVRLLDLGMDPFNFADALLAILAQRLAKALCPKCKQSYRPQAAEVEELAAEYCEGTGLDPGATLKQWQAEYARDGAFALQRAAGCEHCSRSGYRGRLGLHELLTVTPAIKRMIQARAPVSDLVPAALAAGMRTLKQDGLLKVLQGRTDIAQVRAVCV